VNTASAVAPADAPASSEIFDMPEFNVSVATRSDKAIDHIPGSVDLVTSNDIKDVLYASEDITKVLEETIPGYSASRGLITQFGESMRGRLPLYLIDGIPQSTPLRAATIGGASIDQAFVDRVEVIEGPSATEGLGAAGGTINYVTKTPKNDGNEIDIDTSLESQFETRDVGWRTDVTAMHKDKDIDVVVGAAFVSRPIEFDGHDKIIGLDSQGTAEDSMENDLFVKVGHNWGYENSQRIQVSFNSFTIRGNGNYTSEPTPPATTSPAFGYRVPGNVDSIDGDIPDTAVRGVPPGPSSYIFMQNASLQYTNSDFFGGSLTAQLFQDREADNAPAYEQASLQDPRIAPIGTLVDVAQINAHKLGARTIFARPNLLITGLEFDVGVDFLNDTTKQDLLLTNRTWVPPLDYTEWSPFAQLDFDKGPLTISGGMRYVTANLSVPDFTTLYEENSEFVTGGTLSYTHAVYNLGGVYRLGGGWSVSLSDSEGWQIPDVGVILRAINAPNQSIYDRGDLQAIVVTNHEAGVTWRGDHATFGATVYDSYSAAGTSLLFVPASDSTILSRIPQDCKGLEVTAEFALTKELTVGGMWDKQHDKTAIAPGYPMAIDLDMSKYPPEKITSYLKWAFSSKGVFEIDNQNFFSRSDNINQVSTAGASLQESFTGYSLFDLSIRYKTKFGTWALGVENVFNKYYLQAIDSSNVEEFASPPYIYSGPGRSFTLSDSIKL